jgi:hypothetical protein
LNYATWLSFFQQAVFPYLLTVIFDFPKFDIFGRLFNFYQNLNAKHHDIMTLLIGYGLMFLNNRFQIWPAFGLDYSTHTAVS